MSQYENEALAVQNLQRYLRQLSYHDPAITAPPIDGIFASDTRKSLQQFQGTHDLNATGVADRETWERLYACYRASLTEHAPPRAVFFFPVEESFTLFTNGNYGFPIAVLQYMLRELSAQYGDLDTIEVNGTYDAVTENAVLAFQQRNGLTPDGRIDLRTWNAIANQHNILLYGDG